jgi:hypothetical protein
MAPYKQRYFCLLDPNINQQSGRYAGRNPQEAAICCFRALNKKYKESNEPIPTPLKIYIRETTKNSSGKIYMYECSNSIDHEQTIQRRVNEFDRQLRSRYGRMKCNKIITPVPLPNHLKQKNIKSDPVFIEDMERKPITDLIIERVILSNIETDLVIEI